MLSLRTTRTALGLYGTLLVLPTLVLGWLYWHELDKGFESELAAVPENAADGARRITNGMLDRLQKLVEREAQRSFTEYGEYIYPTDAVGDEILPQRSPMTHRSLPVGILAWFSFDRQAGPDGEIEVLVGEDTFGRGGVAEGYLPIIEDFRQRRSEEHRLSPLLELQGELVTYPLSAVAVHMGNRNLECVKKCSEYILQRTLVVRVSDFHLQFYLDDEGLPRAFASRRIRAMGPLDDLPRQAACLKPLMKGFGLHQGFLIDVGWLLQDLPFEIAEQVLDTHQSLRTAPQAGPMDEADTVFATIHPIEALGFETSSTREADYGRLEVEIDTDDIQARFDRQTNRLLALGLMLVLTLATGMSLLYRSVHRELEQAHRTQNFVAAVTHELRTPISTIRLHGEMLLDGWASDPAKQTEYYGRIVRETDRLSTLVENVLEKSRLKESAAEPEEADLNEIVRVQVDDLMRSPDKQDLELRLAPGLPKVWLTREGVAGILSNLIENARKYAPVGEGKEPILIQTRWDGRQALLEVADRGPGVPADEREQIFEAFYRIGSEATRTTTGTGLGLHLVRLHAESAGARVSVHDREGGGSIFRITWRTTN